jgi:type IV secretion system protein VirB10
MINYDNDTQQGPIINRDKRVTKPYSKRIIFFGLLFIAAVIFIIGTQAQKSIDSNKVEQTRVFDAPRRDFASMAAEFQASARRPDPPPPEIRQEIIYISPPEERTVQVVAPPPPPQPPRRRYYSNQGDRQAADQLKMMNIQAIMTPPKVDGFGEEKTASDGGMPQRTQHVQGGIDPALLAGLLQQGEGDPNRQAQKADFLRNEGATLTHQGYSENIPIPQQFYLELKAGTVIPGMLMTGINSDLPGPVMGQVSENVWDSTRGRHVLIPKGTRILGVYDSQITYGQKRVLIVWNRLIFPNGTTLNIAGSPGLDQSGYAGMRGRVNEHWGRIISAALLASLFVTGAEMISPRDNRIYDNRAKTPGEIASEQAANAILNMSARIMNKNMDIQPTITIRPGQRFNIFVEKDIVFPEPYPIGL